MVQKLNNDTIRGVLGWLQAVAVIGGIVYAVWGFEDRVTSLINRQVIAAESRGEVARLEASSKLADQLSALARQTAVLQRDAETLALVMKDHEQRLRKIENRR